MTAGCRGEWLTISRRNLDGVFFGNWAPGGANFLLSLISCFSLKGWYTPKLRKHAYNRTNETRKIPFLKSILEVLMAFDWLVLKTN